MELGISRRRAAIGGASSGLGLATARALIAEGVTVAICGRDRARIDDAAQHLGSGAVPIVADLSTPEGASGFIADATSALGGLDIVVPNAGGPPPGTFASTDVAAYPEALALNLLSVVAMCKAAVPAMVDAGWGRIVAITSMTVRQPSPHLILSNTARAGATGFLKTLALEVAGTGVTVNSVQPGLHATDRLRSLYGADGPDQPTGDPDDFGATVAYLCGEPAKFITGAALSVDGGAVLGLQ